MRVHFALRRSPNSLFVDLDGWLVRVPAEIEAAAENNFNEFRGTQFSLTLDDLDGSFTDPDGQHYLTGGEEITVWIGPPGGILNGGTTAANGSKLWWSGTVDPASLPRSQDSKLLTIRVLQHGSLLNTIEASLPDWTVDGNNQLVINPDLRYRWKGEADDWQRVNNSDGTFNRNEIAAEKTTVYYTPSAKDALTDDLYKDRFATKVNHFHTAGKNVGEVEWPFPNVGGEPSPNWTGPFQPHYHPNFDGAANDWADTSGGIVQDRGSFLRNKNPVLQFRRQSIPDIIAELVSQFNRSARFPLLFDPDADCVLVSPDIQQQIEILQRQPDVDFIDIHLVPGTLAVTPRLYLLVNYLPNDGAPAGSSSIYSIENETELNPLVERYNLPASFSGENICFAPPYRRGLRWNRNPNSGGSSMTGYAYSMTWTLFSTPVQGGFHYSLRFDALWFAISNQTLNVTGPRTATAIEDLGEYTDTPFDRLIVNRSAAVVGSGIAVRASGEPFPPEPDPRPSLEYNNRRYTSRQGGLTVSGALFDRVAVDAENTKLSALLSELAKLTFSRVMVTPDRRLKFISRQTPGSNIHRISADMLVGELISGRKTYDDVQLPSFGSGLVLPDNFKQAARVWYQDRVKGQISYETELGVAAEDLDEPPQPHDTILPPAEDLPELPKNHLTSKYGIGYCADRVRLDTSNAVFRIAASQPLI